MVIPLWSCRLREKFGYATWLCHMRLRLLRQLRLRHMIMPHTGCAGGEKLWKKYLKKLFHLHFSKFTDMLTQQCFFFLCKLKCIFNLCTLNRVRLGIYRLLSLILIFTCYHEKPVDGLGSARDNSAINFSQCRIFWASSDIIHRQPPSLIVTHLFAYLLNYLLN